MGKQKNFNEGTSRPVSSSRLKKHSRKNKDNSKKNADEYNDAEMETEIAEVNGVVENVEIVENVENVEIVENVENVEIVENVENEESMEVYKHFKLVLELQSTKIYQCNLCLKNYKAAKNSDSNLRKHLGGVHNMDVLYASQVTASKKIEIDSQRRKELNKAVLECIIIDSRPFGDFSKSGMKHFLSKAVPGFTQQNRNLITKKLEKRYIE
ncbi:hypothetical protein BpHYR1_028262 [Brachionus plicatilis]|uniref:BED-type domain-containing protein n=1 Tax=Brachionus plicatilis TaxID=10195 RepID=A0A3M7RWZ1_BRAPC|nr:hypothetical protein BpHYR1_028262 [Brachionus plicatilis]